MVIPPATCSRSDGRIATCFSHSSRCPSDALPRHSNSPIGYLASMSVLSPWLHCHRAFRLNAAELHRKMPGMVVRVPLVFVVPGQKAARLASGDIIQRLLPVREIGDESHGRPEPASGLLYRRRRTAHPDRSDVEVASDARNLAPDRVLQLEFIPLTVTPAFYIAALQFGSVIDALSESVQQDLVPVCEPGPRALAQQLLDNR